MAFMYYMNSKSSHRRDFLRKQNLHHLPCFEDKSSEIIWKQENWILEFGGIFRKLHKSHYVGGQFFKCCTVVEYKKTIFEAIENHMGL